MKKLNKLSLSRAKIMSAPEMKHITGGYSDVCGPDLTFYHCIIAGSVVGCCARSR